MRFELCNFCLCATPSCQVGKYSVQVSDLGGDKLFCRDYAILENVLFFIIIIFFIFLFYFTALIVWAKYPKCRKKVYFVSEK